MDSSLRSGVRRLGTWYQLAVVGLVILCVQFRFDIGDYFPLLGAIVSYSLRPFELHWIVTAALSHTIEEPSTWSLACGIAVLGGAITLLARAKAYVEFRGEGFFQSTPGVDRWFYAVVFAQTLYFHAALTHGVAISTHWDIFSGVWRLWLRHVIVPVVATGVYRGGRDVIECRSVHPRWYLFQFSVFHALTVLFGPDDTPVYDVVAGTVPILFGITLNYVYGGKDRAGAMPEATSAKAMWSVVRRSLHIIIPSALCLAGTWLAMCVLYVLPLVALVLFLVFFFVWFPAALLSFNTDFFVFTSAVVGLATYHHQETSLSVSCMSSAVTLAVVFLLAYSIQIIVHIAPSRYFQGALLFTTAVCLTVATYYGWAPEKNAMVDFSYDALNTTVVKLTMHTTDRKKTAAIQLGLPLVFVLCVLHALSAALRIMYVPGVQSLVQRTALSVVTIFLFLSSSFVAMETPAFLTRTVLPLPQSVRVVLTVCLMFIFIGIQKENEEAVNKFVARICGY